LRQVAFNDGAFLTGPVAVCCGVQCVVVSCSGLHFDAVRFVAIVYALELRQVALNDDFTRSGPTDVCVRVHVCMCMTDMRCSKLQ